MKRALLGRDGAGQRRLPSFETNLTLMNGKEMAAPYLRHFAMAAPYLAASTPEWLPGLLLPNISSPKPPAARKAPTRTNLFKASMTLSSSEKCNGCPIASGTVVVTHFGYVPPQTFLCYIVQTGDCETLIPYQVIHYQDDPAQQFTYAANAASSISLEITSFAANNPLNGQATSAHVMDIDDICIYSSGSFELRSTTPKDAISSMSLANGLVGIMGPESFSPTLLHPYHCGTKTYPGWSIAVEAADSGLGANVILSELTNHRWWVNTTFQVSVTAFFESATGDYKEGMSLYAYISTIKGKCPAMPGACAVGYNAWAATEHTDHMIAYATKETCEPDPPGTTGAVSKTLSLKERNQLYRIYRQKQRDTQKKIKCTKPEDPTPVCDIDADDECPTSETPTVKCCRPKRGDGAKLQKPEASPIHQITASGTYTTCELENAVAIWANAWPCGKDITVKCYQFEIRTLVHDSQQQFGPAIVTRLEGITPDIVVQLNIRSAVSGIQTGSARSVAPPSGPSMLGLGDEDAILVQAIFDDPSSQVARVMNTATYRKAAEFTNSITREHATGMMEAAPIGDFIRNIAGTISKIGHGIGGPLGTVGDIIGTIGNVAGGIGDAVGNIFSAPKRARLLAAPRFIKFVEAAPVGLTGTTANKTPRQMAPPASVRPLEGSMKQTPEQIAKSVKQYASWSNNVMALFKAQGPYKSDTMQSFPWVNPTDETAGTANIFLTDEPMSLPGRADPKYALFQFDQFTNIFVDEYLTAGNEPRYVLEALYATLLSERPRVFITTDAEEPIYGDSFAAAILAASYQPSPLATVTGGVLLGESGEVTIREVGLTPEKARVALNMGLTLIAPLEQATSYLRNNSDGTEAVHINDVITGNITQTPTVIAVGNLSELIMALTFVTAASSTPIGPEETAKKAQDVQKSMERQAEVQKMREQYGLSENPTPEELKEKRALQYTVTVPGFDPVEIPILDPAWWDKYAEILHRPAIEKGIGITPAKLQEYIRRGDIHRLQGLAMSVLSRELSKSRKAVSGPKRRPTRQAPYKRPQTTQISSLIQRLRSRGQETDQPMPLEPPAPKRARPPTEAPRRPRTKPTGQEPDMDQ